MAGSDVALRAAWTATVGLHSSSSTSVSYRYFDLESALRSWTASRNEFRPPRPFEAVPPVSGPMKASFTVVFWPQARPGARSSPVPRIDAPCKRSRRLSDMVVLLRPAEVPGFYIDAAAGRAQEFSPGLVQHFAGGG